MDKVLFDKLQEGRKRYQKERSKELRKLIDDLYEVGKYEIGSLSERERFIAGVALYWAEGFKHKDESRLVLQQWILRWQGFISDGLKSVWV